MTEVYVLPSPDFFSEEIKEYVHEISEAVDREVIYIDKRQLPETSEALATTQASPSANEPVVAISLDAGQINPSNYKPETHDPIIAHEITHAQLNSEGYPNIIHDGSLSASDRRKLDSVVNWVSDPVINQRILERGFDLSANRADSARHATQKLLNREWSKHPDKDFPIRYYVSIMLESIIPQSIRTQFHEAFEADLPDLLGGATSYLKLIQSSGFDSPSRAVRTAKLCLEKLGIKLNHLTFSDWESATMQQRQAFLQRLGPPDDDWDSPKSSLSVT